jgi:hypothetical protein
MASSQVTFTNLNSCFWEAKAGWEMIGQASFSWFCQGKMRDRGDGKIKGFEGKGMGCYDARNFSL